jgi:hypothetical protein
MDRLYEPRQPDRPVQQDRPDRSAQPGPQEQSAARDWTDGDTRGAHRKRLEQFLAAASNPPLSPDATRDSPHPGSRDHAKAAREDSRTDTGRTPQKSRNAEANHHRESADRREELPDGDTSQGRPSRDVRDDTPQLPGKHPEGERGPEMSGRTYWAEVPRFLRMWGEHVRLWPERKAAAVDRSRDPEGSWRGDGNQYLNPEVHARTKDGIDTVQEKERPISEDVLDAAQENVHGGWLEGWRHRLKGDDRIKEKVADLLDANPDLMPAEAIKQIPDAIRYTFCLHSQNYVDGYRDMKRLMEARGYEMVYSKNSWDEHQYKGINTRWVTPDGQRFEMQFHTPQSFHAKQNVTHGAYERIRNPLTSKNERSDLHAFQREVSAWIPVPTEVAVLPDFRKKGY